MAETVSLRERIAAARQEYKTIAVPEWSCSINVRKLNGREFDEFQQMMQAHMVDGQVANIADMWAWFLVRVICDGDGVRAYRDNETEELLQQPTDILRRLFDVASDFAMPLKDIVEELEKNSSATGSDASGSD